MENLLKMFYKDVQCSNFFFLPSSFSLNNLFMPLGGLEAFKRASVLSAKLSNGGGLSSGGERSQKPPAQK